MDLKEQIYRFDINDDILCYYKLVLYKATCLYRRTRNDGLAEYFVHYKGWNSKWDEWVEDERLLSVNDANMEKMTVEENVLKKYKLRQRIAKKKKAMKKGKKKIKNILKSNSKTCDKNMATHNPLEVPETQKEECTVEKSSTKKIERTRRIPLPLPTVPLPTVPLPAVPLPAVPLPAVALPAVPLPAVPLPAVALPAVPLPAVPVPETQNNLDLTTKMKTKARKECTVIISSMKKNKIIHIPLLLPAVPETQNDGELIDLTIDETDKRTPQVQDFIEMIDSSDDESDNFTITINNNNTYRHIRVMRH